MNEPNKEIQLDIVSDVMCPWCYVGKRRLEKALALVDPSLNLKVTWRPYQLDATLPAEGKDRQLYLSEKFGGADRAASFYQTIKEAGDGEGIPFDFDAIAVSPNTLDAHRLIHWAREGGSELQDEVVEGLFEAFFTSGKHIGHHDVLGDVAETAGLDKEKILERLASDEDVKETTHAVQTAQSMGVTGVPCFILNMKYAVSGAQEPENLANWISQMAQEAA